MIVQIEYSRLQKTYFRNDIGNFIEYTWISSCTLSILNITDSALSSDKIMFQLQCLTVLLDWNPTYNESNCAKRLKNVNIFNPFILFLFSTLKASDEHTLESSSPVLKGP